MKILLLGATGKTGQLVLEQLIKKDIKPCLVGRNKVKLDALSAQYGGLEVNVANANDSPSLTEVVNEGDLLISTVGPFCELGQIPLQVAVEKGAHYIDSTGEPSFVAHVYSQYEEQVKQSKIVVLTASGFDYVPGHLVATKLLEDLGEQVDTINISYAVEDGSFANLSSGTLSSFIKALFEKGVFYNDKQWHENFLGRESYPIQTLNRKIKGISVSGMECLELPKAYPHLSNVNVYLGWFQHFAGFISGFNRIHQVLFKIPAYYKLMKRLAARFNVPTRSSKNIFAREQGRSMVIAQAFDSNGKLLKECHLNGHNMYYYTGEMLAWIASKIKHGEIKEYGVVGSTRAFGLEAVEQAHKDIGFVLQVKD